MNTSVKHWLLAAMLSMGGGQALANVPNLTVSFNNPTGTVAATDSIEVWVKVSIADDQTPFFFDNALGYPYGMDPIDVPTFGYADGPNGPEYVMFTAWTDVRMTLRLNCGSFGGGSGCAAGQYTAVVDPVLSATSGFPYARLDLQPGDSFNAYVTTLVPSDGTANSGVYQLGDAWLSLDFTGTSALGTTRESIGFYPCATSLGCSFTRTVAPVPEPQSWALLLAGAGVLSLGIRRR